MNQIKDIKFSLFQYAFIPHNIIDGFTQRWDIWYNWIDNFIMILLGLYSIWYFKKPKVQIYSNYVLVAASMGMLVYAGIYSYLMSGWTFYSITICLWALYVVLFESFWEKMKYPFLVYVSFICVYNKWMEMHRFVDESWSVEILRYHGVIVGLFFIFSIAAIVHLSSQYQKFSLESLESKDSKISFQNDLFSILAHNIRTPLATLTMQYKLAEMRGRASVSLDNTQLPLKQLELTINTMLDNRKALKSEKVLSLSDVLEELKELYENLHIEGDVNSKHMIEYGVVMALDCFISNALKYDNQPVLRVIEGETLTFELDDKGGGMDTIDFKEYGNPVVSKSRGLGIGVHLSKEILSHLGYTCEVGNTKDIGLTIRLYKPSTEPKKPLNHTQIKVLC